MAIDDSRLPTGKVAGRDLVDAGNRTGVTDTYGAEGAFDSGINGRQSITGDTKSNPDDGCCKSCGC